MSSQYPQSSFGGVGGGERAGVSVEDLPGLNGGATSRMFGFRPSRRLASAGRSHPASREGAASRGHPDLARRIADLNHQMTPRSQIDVQAAFEAHEELLNVGLSQKADAPDAPASSPGSPRASHGVSSAELERRVQAMEARLETFATRSALDKASQETRAELAALARSLRSATKEDLRGKADASELAAIAESKVGLDEVNRALAEVSSELDGKASVAALETSIREMEIVNRRPSPEYSVGRWIWKSGRVVGRI